MFEFATTSCQDARSRRKEQNLLYANCKHKPQLKLKYAQIFPEPGHGAGTGGRSIISWSGGSQEIVK